MAELEKTIAEKGYVLTILLQDYFHRGVFKPVIGEKQWSRFESRLDKNVENVLQLLDTYNIKATFFTLGWIADQNPGIIYRIASEGHEIACAGYWAHSIREMAPNKFREDLRRSRNALEKAGANKIIGYRCAYQWFRKKDFWAFDVLLEEGFFYDASYRPAFYEFNKNSLLKYACEYQTKSAKIWEFPTSTTSILGLNIPISGGSYIRQMPHFLMFHYFKNWCKKTEAPFVLYFHPWELDTYQPEITAVGKLSKIRQYRNLGKIERILPAYFKGGNFQSISQYLKIPLEYPDTSVSRPQSPTFNLIPCSSGLKPQTSNLTPITIIIPCYNETSSISYLAKAIGELCLEAKDKYYLKFIFVDDKSTDDTYSTLQERFGMREDCKIIRHLKNFGVAESIKTGLKEADTEIVCSIDADCSYDPLELLNMIPLLKDDVDMVTGSPYHREGFVIGVPLWRLFLSKSLSKIYHLFLRNKLATYTSCFRVYRRNAVLEINCKYADFRGIIEVLAKADIHGQTIREYPTTLQSRIFGHSKMRVFKTIMGHLKLLGEIMKNRYSFRGDPDRV